MLEGIDFSFGSGLTTAQIKAGGKQFVARYLSGGNPKDITRAELANYKAAGIPVIFVWETTGTDMTSVASGRADATAANMQLGQVGAPGAVVFFAADEAQEPDLRGYFDGVLEVLPKTRSGVYGGLGSVRTAFDGALVDYGWQTLAWSNGQWDDRALIRQVQNNVKFGPATVDLDQAAYWNSTRVLGLDDDFGQYPRPKAAVSKQWKEWTSAGDYSLNDFAYKIAGKPPSTLLRETAVHYGVFDPILAGYLNELAGGKIAATAKLPKGSRFWVFA